MYGYHSDWTSYVQELMNSPPLLSAVLRPGTWWLASAIWPHAGRIAIFDYYLAISALSQLSWIDRSGWPNFCGYAPNPIAKRPTKGLPVLSLVLPWLRKKWMMIKSSRYAWVYDIGGAVITHSQRTIGQPVGQRIPLCTRLNPLTNNAKY